MGNPERPPGKHVPIVAMTAHAMVGDRERCLAAGMDDYVAKPIHASDMFAAIERVMDSSQNLRAHQVQPGRVQLGCELATAQVAA